ncbi:MAG: D-alanine--D-alanine ligase [bacterium]
MPDGKITVAVLMGGKSSEHEVSLSSGSQVVTAFNHEKYQILPVVITKEGEWLLWRDQNRLPATCERINREEWEVCSLGRALDRFRELDVQAVFLALHGAFGEDGTMQGLLECAGLPYTGSGVLASALAIDKRISGEIFAEAGLLTPKTYSLKIQKWRSEPKIVQEEILKNIGLPCVVKPANLGSSVGISIVRKLDALREAIDKAFNGDRLVLVQDYLKGEELTCAVLDEGRGKNARALPPTQIIPKGGTFFDYSAKYQVGGSEEVTPPRLPRVVIEKIQDTALRAHLALGCSGMSRTDMILVGDDLYVLETNTIPGMTPTSLLPQAAAKAGLSFAVLLDAVTQAALKTS